MTQSSTFSIVNTDWHSLDDVLVCDSHIDSVTQHSSISSPKLQHKHENSHKLSDEEEKLAVVACCNGSSIQEVALQLKRPAHVIRNHLLRLGFLTSLDGNREIPRVMVKSIGNYS
jgi:hypothetical protein